MFEGCFFIAITFYLCELPFLRKIGAREPKWNTLTREYRETVLLWVFSRQFAPEVKPLKRDSSIRSNYNDCPPPQQLEYELQWKKLEKHINDTINTWTLIDSKQINYRYNNEDLMHFYKEYLYWNINLIMKFDVNSSRHGT